MSTKVKHKFQGNKPVGVFKTYKDYAEQFKHKRDEYGNIVDHKQYQDWLKKVKKIEGVE